MSKLNCKSPAVCSDWHCNRAWHLSWLQAAEPNADCSRNALLIPHVLLTQQNQHTKTVLVTRGDKMTLGGYMMYSYILV